MDANFDFHLLYRVANAFTESFVHTVKSTMTEKPWNFFSSDDEYARDLRQILSFHLDENKRAFVRLASLQRLNEPEKKKIEELLPLLNFSQN
jgi:hypothetical protein